MLVPVILCGGSGKRLWPLSRQAYPKPLLVLQGEKSMLQQTVLRLAGLPDLLPPIVVCNHLHRFMVAEQLREINIEAIILLEPCGKNTAPAIALAALQAPQHTLLVMPADHHLALNAFHEAVGAAKKLSDQDHLVTLGIIPEHPETGYGYIQQGESLPNTAGFKVNAFIEKPGLSQAEQFLQSPQYLWNSGIFIFKAEIYLQELAKFKPEILTICRKTFENAKNDLDFIRLEDPLFATCEDISIDYAVMQHSDRVAVVPLTLSQWNDLGSWEVLWKTALKNAAGNVVRGDVVTQAVTNSYLQANHRLLAVLGVDEHIIIETNDAVLVAHKKYAQAVKQLVEELELKQRIEVNYHRRVYRPWGYYEVMDEATHFKVKRILIKPGASLSLQKHVHRAEHWVVIEGQAEVIAGEKKVSLQRNQSIYIPAGQLHRLQNKQLNNLVIIEVQTGDYLGEDDIIRFEDQYDRELTHA